LVLCIKEEIRSPNLSADPTPQPSALKDASFGWCGDGRSASISAIVCSRRELVRWSRRNDQSCDFIQIYSRRK
jgi:hypothetical protein